MAAEADQPRERCAVHAERPSVGRCEECGRATCLGCAVPFRGRLLCAGCASKALGTPEPIQRPAVRVPRGSVAIVGGLLLVALGATIPPWHRSGTLTRPFSAWRALSEVAVLVAVLALVAAGVILVAALRRGLPGRLLGFVAGLSAAAAAAATVSLVRAPDFYAFTLAPFVVLAASALAAAAGSVALARGRRAARFA